MPPAKSSPWQPTQDDAPPTAHERPVLPGLGPVLGMGAAGPVVALVAGDAAPAAQVVVAVAGRAARGTVGVDLGAVAGRVGPARGMAAGPVVAAVAARRAVLALPVVAVAAGARAEAARGHVLAVEIGRGLLVPAVRMGGQAGIVGAFGAAGHDQQDAGAEQAGEVRRTDHGAQPPWHAAQPGAVGPSPWQAMQDLDLERRRRPRAGRRRPGAPSRRGNGCPAGSGTGHGTRCRTRPRCGTRRSPARCPGPCSRGRRRSSGCGCAGARCRRRGIPGRWSGCGSPRTAWRRPRAGAPWPTSQPTVCEAGFSSRAGSWQTRQSP